MNEPRTPVVLTIAGSDSGGGAGIQADLKTFAALGVYGATAITALTAQNTRGVQAVHMAPPEIVAAQIASVLDDLNVSAIKIGMLGTARVVCAVAHALSRAREIPLILDPVMIATSGDALLDADAVGCLISDLVPLAELITPNLAEAARLLGAAVATSEVQMQEQAIALIKLGCRAVLVKGGHGEGPESVDMYYDGRTLTRLTRSRIATRNTHGTGCTLSAAIAAFRACGMPLDQAVAAAKDYLWQALFHGSDIAIGKTAGAIDKTAGAIGKTAGSGSEPGHGPVHHMFSRVV